MFISLKTSRLRKISADQVIARLREPLSHVPGASLFLQPVQDLRIGRAPGRRAVPVHAPGRRLERALRVGAARLQETEDASRRSPTSTPTSRTWGCRLARDRPRDGLAARRHAADDRRHALRRLRPAAGLDDVHAAEPVPRRHVGRAAVLAEPGRPESPSTSVGKTGDLVPLAAFTRYERSTTSLSVNAPGLVPVGDAVLQPAAGRRARRRRRRDRPGAARAAPAGRHARQLPGHRAGLPGIARERADPDRAALLRCTSCSACSTRAPIHPDHDPLDAALGGRRRAAGAAPLQDRALRHRADRDHPAHRHREEERDPDDRLRARGRAARGQERRRRPSSRRASCVSARSR